MAPAIDGSVCIVSQCRFHGTTSTVASTPALHCFSTRDTACVHDNLWSERKQHGNQSESNRTREEWKS
jgi:hypothetical protein